MNDPRCEVCWRRLGPFDRPSAWVSVCNECQVAHADINAQLEKWAKLLARIKELDAAFRYIPRDQPDDPDACLIPSLCELDDAFFEYCETA